MPLPPRPPLRPLGLRRVVLLTLVGILVGGANGVAQAQQPPQILEAHLGLGGYYKVGCWTPLRLHLRGGEESLIVTPRVRVRDGEGLLTAIVDRPLELAAGEERTVEILVRIGQLDAPVEVQLFAEGERGPVVKQTFDPGFPGTPRGIEAGDAATASHYLEVGGVVGLKLASSQERAGQEYVASQLAHIDSVMDLPRHYLAYEGIDTVVLATSNRDPWTALRSDDSRLRALIQWVELGGRLILFCGRNSGDLLGSDGSLRGLAPGRFVGMVTLTDLRQLELYSGSSEPFPGRAQTQLGVPHLTNVRGNVELSVTQEDVTLPLVIRARHGLGQVVFAGFDPDVPPFRDWASREAVLARLAAVRDETLGENQADFYYDYAEDLTTVLEGAMESRLETAGVRTPPFLWIAGLILLYILAIGPGDYLLVRYGLKRMEWTWVTFPLIVIVTSAGAYWLANHLKGRDRLITQVELVDVDTTRDLVRGTMWSQIFSPKPDSYTLSLQARLPDGSETSPHDEAVTWLGKPTAGIGGMNNSAVTTLLGGTAFAWSPNRDRLMGVPIEVWSTKSFVARWYGDAKVDVASDLARTVSDGVRGTITNNSGVDLTDAMLVYGELVWKLGDLPDGKEAAIEPLSAGARGQAPRKLRNLMEERFNLAPGQQAYVRTQRMRSVPLHGVVELMMFNEAAGGRKLTGVWNRYQDFVDLSHALDRQTAMLFGRTTVPGSELLRSEGEETAPTSMRGPRDSAVTLYRFILPVAPAE